MATNWGGKSRLYRPQQQKGGRKVATGAAIETTGALFEAIGATKAAKRWRLGRQFEAADCSFDMGALCLCCGMMLTMRYDDVDYALSTA